MDRSAPLSAHLPWRCCGRQTLRMRKVPSDHGHEAEKLVEPPALRSAHRAGTQSLERAFSLLRLVTTRPGQGWRLVDLAATTGMDRGTIHRMLTFLVKERALEQRSSDRHYVPGPVLFEFGLARSDLVQFHRRAEPFVKQFAQRMGGIGLLLFRSGNDFVSGVCVGSLPLSNTILMPGTRRPLVTAAGGVAILLGMDPLVREGVVEENLEQEMVRSGATRVNSIRRVWQRSKSLGFAANLGDTVPGQNAFGVKVVDVEGEAFAGLALLGPEDLLGSDKAETIREELEAVSGQLTALAARLRV